MVAVHVRKELNSMLSDFKASSKGLLEVTSSDFATYEKGTYIVAVAKPSKRLASLLTVDREIAVLFTSFTDLQARTMQVLRRAIESSDGRLESTVAVVIHKDSRGNTKLANWGRESGLSILPICFGDRLPTGVAFEQLLCFEMYSHDPFDITGPVSGDAHFFGRRSEAQDLARALQKGQIKSALGIRKIGKTSIINRVVADIQRNYASHCVMVDCSQDHVWALDSAGLMTSLSETVSAAVASNKRYCTLTVSKKSKGVADSTQELYDAVSKASAPVIIFLDEVDYITPGSPTAAHWRIEFNKFWRNFRSVYQESCRSDAILSLMVCGVSSRWFSVESIDGIENAALSMIPEDYMSPLPRGATVAMIKKIGRVAGLEFGDLTSERIATVCADMPFWVRKAGSFVHRNIEIANRPLAPTQEQVDALLHEFVDTEGATLSHYALRHLFRVYPELENAALSLTGNNAVKPNQKLSSILRRYGILTPEEPARLAGEMIQRGCEIYKEEKSQAAPEETVATKPTPLSLAGDDWAEEIAVISKRRNLLEKRMRTIVVNFIRQDVLANSGSNSVSDRILAVVPTARRAKMAHLAAEAAVEQLFWKELVTLIASKEWRLMEKLFGDKGQFRNNSEIVNDRYDAHAKDFDGADLALYRRSLKHLEDCIARVL